MKRGSHRVELTDKLCCNSQRGPVRTDRGTHALSSKVPLDASKRNIKKATMRVAALIVGALAGTASAFQAPRQTAARAAPLQSIKINTRSGESVDSVIMRLRREVNKSGHLRTLRHKRFHEDAREKKKRKVAEARRKMKFMRQRKRRSQQQGP